MARLRDILRKLPRRRRHWRYVSPRRRTAGLVILAVLTVAMFAYVYLPLALAAWTREAAARYLASFTAGRVEVRGASFSVFGGLELQGVRVDVPNAPPSQRFFQADTVVLRHRPWSLFTEGRLDVREIVCISPTLTLDFDAQKGRYAAMDLLDALRRHRLNVDAAGIESLPVVSIRDVTVQSLTGQLHLDITMVPDGPGRYRIAVEEDRVGGGARIRGTLSLDLTSGKLDLSGEMPIPNIDGVLPDQYVRWRRRYALDGKVLLKSRPAAGGPARQVLEATLAGGSLQLPAAEGGLDLTGVSGKLVFDSNEVRVVELAGAIPQAGGATFRMSGRYGGYDPDSPFELEATVRGMSLPRRGGVAGWIEEFLDHLRQMLQPAGQLDVLASVRRGAGGRIEAHGSAVPRGMSVTYRNFPYPLEEVTGTIEFDPGEIRLRDVSGRHGEGRMVLNGRVDLTKPWCYDLTVAAEGAVLDGALRAALPAEPREVWDKLAPTGRGGATVRVWRDGRGTPERTDVRLAMDGRTSAAYCGFPYRLEALRGTVRIAGSQAELEDVRGRHGAMTCRLRGTVGGVGAGAAQTNLAIDANDVPLDDELIAAIGGEMGRAARTLRMAGMARHVRVRLRQNPGEKLDYRVEADLDGSSFRPEVLPYAVGDANGTIAVVPGRVVIDRLAGRHGETPVRVDGQVLLDGNRPGVDLRIAARSVRLDEELLTALPPAARRIWRTVQPAGLADVEMAIQDNMPGSRRRFDYRLTLDARGMSIRHEAFPYPLRGLTGRVVAVPGRVTLTGLTASHGAMRLTASGVLTADANGEDARLSVGGSSVPIDAEFLAAMPGALAPLAKRFRPGGTCDLDLAEIHVSQPSRDDANGGAGPGGTAQSAPSSRAAAGATWALRGTVACRDAVIDLGQGHKTFSGSLRGQASQGPGGLAIDAQVALDSVTVAQQKLTHAAGRLVKDRAAQIVRLVDLTARAHGGRAAGFAEIRLAEPLEYGVSLTVEDVDLAELFQAALEGETKPADVKGRLAGTIQLTATPGAKPAVRATGILRISDAKLYKLPVLLSLLHVLFLALPGDSAFSEGNVSYRLADNTLTFEEIFLRGPGMSIVGSGTLDLASEALRLNFLAGPPRKLPRIASVEALLEGIAREIAEIHVRGTLRKPQMRTVPLRSLEAAINELLNPGRQQR